MWKLIIFTIITGLLIYTSRASLRKPDSHGFYRFLAWESILLLFLLNADRTFLVATARADERECTRFFGDAYQTYMQKTKRFIPFLF